jgi:hypothetical protein
MDRLLPNQPDAAAPVGDCWPCRDNAENSHGNGQSFPEANERLVRHTGISDAKDREEKHHNERKLFPEKAFRALKESNVKKASSPVKTD